MPSAATIQIRKDHGIARITLNNPPLNIIDIPAMRELSAALVEVADAQFVVLEGAGERGFSAGVSIPDHAPERVGEMLKSFHGIFRQIASGDAITIAAVHGLCLGGGCELATFCDFVIATESARFGQPEIKLGCFPPIAMVTLPQLAGPRAALDLILTGRTITAQEAHGLGLVTRVVHDNELQASVAALLFELRGTSRKVLQITRRALRRMAGLGLDQALEEVEKLYLEELMATEDAAEGVRAFIEKRTPEWHGR